MPQLIVLALAGIGAYATYKWLRKQTGGQSVKPKPEDASVDGGNPKDLGTLQRDPDTGEYRPK